MLGLRDYARKNGFFDVVLGLSGGLDSALVAALAADALGPEHVHCRMMPSRLTSIASVEDAAACAAMIGAEHRSISIGPAIEAYRTMLAEEFAGLPEDVTEENIQARARGMTLMALSNKFGWLVLSTGNKSETAVGYATLYGDTCGGYAPLKDVYKTDVFALARWRNANRPLGGLGPGGEVIPERIITKAPTAELSEGQTDEQALGGYDRLDAVLEGLIERELDPHAAAASASAKLSRPVDPDYAIRIARLVKSAEWKRRQGPIGPKLTPRPFGKSWRYPITNRAAL
jgi:NAD+ synthase